MRNDHVFPFPDTGKIQNGFFKDLVFPYCGATRKEVITGPAYGVDVALIQLPNGMAMALTSDPLSLIPTLGLRESAWLSVQLMANDMATTGLAPQYAQFVLNLPPTLSVADFEQYWKYIHEFCKRLGVAITGGHTGRFEGQHSTVSGGGTMISIGVAEDMITSKGAAPGDVVIITKTSALVATSILAMSFPETIKDAFGDAVHQQACDLFYETSAVEAGVIAGEFNQHTRAVTAMHDVTEGGVLGGLYELTQASGCGILIDEDNIPVGNAQQKIADLFELNPLLCVGAGSMIITVKADKSTMLLNLLTSKNIPASIIGKIMKQEEGIHVRSKASTRILSHPGVDPYWAAFTKAYNEGWK